MKLNDEIIEIVENNDFYISEITKQHDSYYVDINQYTPCGEDWWETIGFDGTDKGFIEAIEERYKYFDVNEEAEIWIESRGTRGVPDSIKDLIEDAEWKKSMLKKLVCKLKKDSTDYVVNNYKVTITIESNEETETMEYWVEADSFEEAVENVKNELDI